MIQAARLYGPKEIRVEPMRAPEGPGSGEVLLHVDAVGVCGSDLHMFEDSRIGDTDFPEPLVLGHEFMGTVVSISEGALDGNSRPLRVGQRVAVEPSVPDESHEQYELGNPNLAPRAFYGLFPDHGALRERMIVRARGCFPIPDGISDAAGALLEPLGVALHAVGLGHVRLGDSVAVIGCGPIGMLLMKAARLAGATEVYACDRFEWRARKAKEWGATSAWVHETLEESAEKVCAATGGRGADVVFEAAWAGEAALLAAEVARLGGRVVLVGIPGDDTLTFKHSTLRRKGLTISMARRSKHTYPRAIELAASGLVDLDDLVSHSFPLSEAAEAFDLNYRYEDGVIKIIIHP